MKGREVEAWNQRRGRPGDSVGGAEGRPEVSQVGQCRVLSVAQHPELLHLGVLFHGLLLILCGVRGLALLGRWLWAPALSVARVDSE